MLEIVLVWARKTPLARADWEDWALTTACSTSVKEKIILSRVKNGKEITWVDLEGIIQS